MNVSENALENGLAPVFGVEPGKCPGKRLAPVFGVEPRTGRVGGGIPSKATSPYNFHCKGLCLFLSGAAEEIRTPDLQVRSLLLYPAELRPRIDRGQSTEKGGAWSRGNLQKWHKFILPVIQADYAGHPRSARPPSAPFGPPRWGTPAPLGPLPDPIPTRHSPAPPRAPGPARSTPISSRS